MTQVVLWLVLAELLAWAWFVLAHPLFFHWPDRGFGVSKAAGLLALQTPLWILGWIGIPSSAAAGWMMTGLLVGGALVWLFRRGEGLRSPTQPLLRECAIVEAVWLTVTMAFLCLRATRPDIIGGEKFTDFAFLNAAMRSQTLPLADPWLAGHSVNYYHFGFVGWAVIARLLRTPPAVAYNLAVALIPGLVAAAAYSVARRLSDRALLAAIIALAVVGLGNLAGAAQAPAIGSSYDVWSPSRVIPGTINEFPFFSFFWGDLHPHLMAMPNLFVFTALCVRRAEETRPRANNGVLLASLLGATAGVAVATSPWDIVAIGLLFSAVLIVSRAGMSAKDLLFETTVVAAALLAVTLPAARTASPGGIAAGLASTHSPIGPFLLVQLPWLFPAALFLARDAGTLPWTMVLFGLAVSFVAGLLTASITVALLVVLVLLAWALLVRTGDRVLALAAPGLTLLLAAELFFIDDSYGRAFERMNIVFKFHLTATLLLGVGSAAFLTRAWYARGTVRIVGAVAMGVFGLASLVYPMGASLAALNSGSRTLDGLGYLAREQAGDRAAISYLEQQRGVPVVAEATGEPYTYAARISSNTGLPAIIGWANHERLWRRDTTARDEIAARLTAVRELYEGSPAAATAILHRYNARYVVVGQFERTTYPAGDFAKFEQIGRKVLDVSGTAVYAIDAIESRP